jgi:hypothetical protein
MMEEKTDNSKSLDPPPPTRCLKWSGYAVFIWSVGYMLPHLYWALGGTAGLSLLLPSAAELPQWKLINWVASVILTAAGLLGIAFVYLKRRGFLSRLMLAVALFGCAVAASHGFYGIIYRILQLTGVIGAEVSPFGAKSLWADLLLFEPWFLIEGILLAIVGWCYLDQPRHRRIWLTLCVIATIALIFTGLLGVRFA